MASKRNLLSVPLLFINFPARTLSASTHSNKEVSRFPSDFQTQGGWEASSEWKDIKEAHLYIINTTVYLWFIWTATWDAL